MHVFSDLLIGVEVFVEMEYLGKEKYAGVVKE